MRRLLFLSLLAVAACQGRPQPQHPDQSHAAVAAEPGAPRYRPSQPAAWFDREIGLAEEEFAAGDLRAALERAYNAVQHSPGEEHQARLVALLQELNRKALELQTIAATVVPAKDPVVFGEPVRVRLRLENKGKDAARVPARPRGSSRSLIIFDVIRRDHDIRASVVTTRQRVLLPLRKDVELDAGASVELEFDLGAMGNDRPLNGFRSYEIGGLLRPAWVEIGGIRRWEAVALDAARIRSFRAGYEHLTDDPVRRIGQAIAKDAPIHLLTASALVPAARRREAVDILVEAVRGDRYIDWAMFGALNYLCRIELGRDAQAWKAWWPRVRDTFFEEPGPRKDPTAPTFGE